MIRTLSTGELTLKTTYDGFRRSLEVLRSRASYSYVVARLVLNGDRAHLSGTKPGQVTIQSEVRADASILVRRAPSLPRVFRQCPSSLGFEI